MLSTISRLLRSTLVALTLTGLPLIGQTPHGDTSQSSLDATILATHEYQKTGIARTVQIGDYLAYPYGRSQPTLTCSVLRACIIELQPGEQFVGKPPMGDTERWSIRYGAWGPNGSIPLVIVKPTDCNITTNLVIPTNRHLYEVTLDAPPCNEAEMTNAATQRYTRRIRFYYPDEDLSRWANEIPLGKTTSGFSPEQLNYGYKWKADKRMPWTPEQIFDDGAHLYIKVPATARNSIAPVLFAVSEEGKTLILNYTTTRDFYITDRLVSRAALVIQEDGKERRITIERVRGR